MRSPSPWRWCWGSAGGGFGGSVLAQPWMPESTTCSTTRFRRPRRTTVTDLVFVLLTVGLFVVLTLVVRGVERL
jgi:hypothetical protein